MSKRSSTESILISSHDSRLHTIPTRGIPSSKRSKSELHKREPTNIHSKKHLRARMKTKKHFNSARSSDIESNTEDSSPFGFKQENITQLPIDEEEDNVMDDIYKYRQLPNIDDISEACFGFIVTAIGVSLLLSISSIVVLSVDLFTPLFSYTH